jgi:phage regulator Rha-like protein
VGKKMNEMMSVLEKMSSLEIAERTGKEHKHVLRDIRTMIDQLGSPNLDSNQYQVVIGNNNKTYEILLDKELTLVLATGYNVPLRLKIIKRWQELEAVQDKPVMDELEMVIASAQHIITVRKEQKEQSLRLSELEWTFTCNQIQSDCGFI